MRAAVIQMNSQDDKEANLRAAERGIEDAGRRGAELVLLPELFTYLGPPGGNRAAAEPVPGPATQRLAAMAAKHRLTLIGGSLLERDGGDERLYNTSPVFDRMGRLVARYRKIHLFDVDLPGEPPYRESATIAPGRDAAVVESPFGWIGLSICYDLRFPELSRRLTALGAELITVPAAFTAETGKDHWEVLLRARAIENQVFVLAAAQVGTHPPNRACHGHSMIIDPWGTVLARAPHREAVVLADLDLDDVKRVRRQLPALQHRRPDLFSG